MDIQDFIKQAEEGNTEAQFQLGLAYYNGEGISKNYRKAYKDKLEELEKQLDEYLK